MTMPGLKEAPQSSLRNKIMIAFFLAIILLGVSITTMSHHILRHTLAGSTLPTEDIQAIGRQFTHMLTGFTLAGAVVAILMAALLSRTITERKNAEEGLKESLSLLEATLESTADGILVVDTRGNIKSFNRQFTDMWRIPESVLETKEDDKALSFVLGQLKAPAVFIAKVRELYSQPENESFDILEFKDGRVIERYSKPQVVSGQIVGRVWSFRDITEKHHAQQKQERLLRRVADINEELTHFAYVVSHDLKAPLRGIKLLAEWLYTDYGDQLGDDARENLDLLQSRVDRMHNLIEGVLQYSRVGRIKEDVVEVDLNEALGNIIDVIAPPEHVEIAIEGALPTITCEETRINQVLQNLLTNAVNYMDKPAGKIVVACQDDGDVWTFSVRDNGPGIEEKYFERIFKIFQTLTPRDEYESTGVGLTLVKKIVELYGGKIWVESEVGQGSTFRFTFAKQKSGTEDKPALASAGVMQ